MKTRLIIVFSLLLALSATANAQRNGGEGRHKMERKGEGPRFSPEEFKKKMEAFIRQHAELTDGECATVFPILEEMNGKKRELGDKAREIKHSSADMTDDEATAAIEKLLRLREEETTLSRTYYKKMATAVGPKKVLRIIKAEEKFMRNMFHQKGNPDGRHKNGAKK